MKLLDIQDLETPTPSAHAASVEYYKGEPVYAWFGGTREGAPDVRIYIKYRGHVYPLKPATGVDLPAWNPVLFTMEDKLYMFFKIGTFCDSWQTFLLELKTTANGKALMPAKAIMLPAGFNGPVKTRPVVVDNVVYCGSSVETHFKWTSYLETMTYYNGAWSFERSMPVPVMTQKPLKGIIQPAMWLDPEHDLMHSLFRSSSDSDELWYGYTAHDKNIWAAATATSIPNPNSGVDVVAHSNGKTYLIYNPSPKARTPLSIAEFEMDPQPGRRDLTIKEEIIIDEIGSEWGWDAGTPEVSYPYAIEAPDGNITVAYTYRRKTIKVATVSL